MLCVTKTIVWPLSCQSRSSRRFISSRVNASSAPNGSSRSRTSGFCASARTIEARCCMPPESSRGIECTNSVNPVCCSSASTRTRSTGFLLISKGNSMFWRRLRQGSRFASWKIMPVCCGRGPSTSVPSSVMRPPVSACRPEIAHSSVVLPHPLGPRIVTSSPSATSSEMSSSAWTGPALARVDLRGALDAQLRLHQNHPASSGLPYCISSMTAPSTSTNATRRKLSPRPVGSKGSARIVCPSIATPRSSTR